MMGPNDHQNAAAFEISREVNRDCPRDTSTPEILFRATGNFLHHVREDLKRPHPFALERVGFITVRCASAGDKLLLLAESYYPVPDSDYVEDNYVGARIGSEAIRAALERALLGKVGVFHVHMHHLSYRLWFSDLDLREQAKLVPHFFKVRPQIPHGAIVLDPVSIAGRAWLRPDTAMEITEFNIVGSPTIVSRPSALNREDR